MMLWLKNCQRRNDRAEAARVACDLGDRALNDGDVAGAREWFERASLYDPENELAKRRLRTLDGAAADAPATGASQPTAVTTDAGHLHVRTEHDEPVVVDLGELIDEFQRAIGPELASDPQGHYDLGVSYREMGLTEQAVQSLRIAAKAPAFRLRAGELAGRCLLDLGHFDEAAEVLRETLGAPDLVPSAAVDLRYQLALALEAAGHSVEALAEFERVYAAQANYPDVAMKIRLLRKTAGAA
jgi:tetratricopeptide (TPR) repeat protein